MFTNNLATNYRSAVDTKSDLIQHSLIDVIKTLAGPERSSRGTIDCIITGLPNVGKGRGSPYPLFSVHYVSHDRERKSKFQWTPVYRWVEKGKSCFTRLRLNLYLCSQRCSTHSAPFTCITQPRCWLAMSLEWLRNFSRNISLSVAILLLRSLGSVRVCVFVFVFISYWFWRQS